jgi:hypothetical protein
VNHYRPTVRSKHEEALHIPHLIRMIDVGTRELKCGAEGLLVLVPHRVKQAPCRTLSALGKACHSDLIPEAHTNHDFS